MVRRPVLLSLTVLISSMKIYHHAASARWSRLVAPGATDLALTEALLPRWRRAADAGHADEDLTAVYAAG